MPLPQNCPVGPRKRRNKTPKKDLESAVLWECLQYLDQRSDVAYVERRNTGAVEFEGGGFLRFGSPGAADIWCLIRGSDWGLAWDSVSHLAHIEIECKRRDGKGRQSPEQIEFQEFCDSHHIPYLLVTSADELEEKLRIVLDT